MTSYVAGLSVGSPEASEEEEVTDLTQTDGASCRLACPFNLEFPSQTCIYTIRVGEVYKGNYSVSLHASEDLEPSVWYMCQLSEKI